MPSTAASMSFISSVSMCLPLHHFFRRIALGGHGATGATNVKAAMLGLSYGYYLKLNHGWGLDFYVGGGILYAMYNTPGSTEVQKSGIKPSLSRLGVVLSYKF
ncbi:MAG TPA: hypothetical protein DCG00_05350 [Alistipes sp.]|nr:hypothetical protein [Alistipes sp.]